ncbi:MAG: integrase domain-containing protein [Gammaproteobacteria bacterium]
MCNAWSRCGRTAHEELGWKPVSIGTLKNRLAQLRWWAGKTNKAGVVAKSNAHYGIGNRTLVSPISKAITLDGEALQKVTDPYIRASLLLQREFGLRREEAIKFIPCYADRGDRMVLKDTWTKGGKERALPVRTESQREALQKRPSGGGAGIADPGRQEL